MATARYPTPSTSITMPSDVPARIVEATLLIAALGANWLAASLMPSQLFSYTSLALFVWLNVFVVRLNRIAAILLLPITITRLATTLSLVAIEAGAYMPEVNRAGMAGDACASFVAFTALFYLTFVLVFGWLERPLTAFAKSELLDHLVALLAWPTVAFCAAWGALAFLHGVSSGFPLLEGVDRFLYRRYYSSSVVLILLDNKYLVSVLLGAIAFSPVRNLAVRYSAICVFLGLTVLYLLFGDKFFTILTEISFFAMPLMLRRSDRILFLLVRGLPIAVMLAAAAISLNIYIFSDYGRVPLERGVEKLGERVAEQGELWYVASRDFRRATAWDQSLVGSYVRGLDDKVPAAASFRNGVETYYFIQKYAPAKLAASARKNQGWVQFTMGYEAMGLVMFGHVGVAVLMVLGGILAALSALYLRRALRSGFPLSLLFGVWTYLQVYFVIQQASLWPIAAPGQVKRFLLFMVIEAVLFSLAFAENTRGSWRLRRGSRMRSRHGAASDDARPVWAGVGGRSIPRIVR